MDRRGRAVAIATITSQNERVNINRWVVAALLSELLLERTDGRLFLWGPSRDHRSVTASRRIQKERQLHKTEGFSGSKASLGVIHSQPRALLSIIKQQQQTASISLHLQCCLLSSVECTIDSIYIYIYMYFSLYIHIRNNSLSCESTCFLTHPSRLRSVTIDSATLLLSEIYRR